jgi:LysR family transcriptional regulator, glycine cleavage system transcriptional activator
MDFRYPSLNALKAFEAAGRHQCFKTAAEELHVTPGAISRQIKSLEKALGIELFVRSNREVRLTPESTAYLAALTASFRQIDNATRSFVRDNQDGPIRLVCSMSVSMRWLLPRLPRFHALYPHRLVSLNTALPLELTDINPQTTDIVIRMGGPEWPSEIESVFLFSSQLVAVCSPQLLASEGPLDRIDDLKNHTLLTSLLRPNLWHQWLTAAGAAHLRPRGTVKLESSALTYAAAVEGLGVALGELTLIQDDLKRRRLVSPLPFLFNNDIGFYLIYSKHTASLPRIKEFIAWILSEVNQ